MNHETWVDIIKAFATYILPSLCVLVILRRLDK